MTLRHAEAMMVLEMLLTEEIPNIAAVLLAQGLESPSLVLAAGWTRDDFRDPRQLFQDALEELRPVRMSKAEALKSYAGFISSKILSGEATPIVGARQIWRAVLNADLKDFHELDAFIYAASELEDRPSACDLFEAAIRAEAKRWTSEHHKG